MIKRKNFITNVITAVLLLVLVSICFYAYTVSPKTELSVRDVELNTIQLDYSSILNEFENAELKTEGSLTTFVGYKTLDASLFDELDNVSDSNVEQEEGCQVKYNFSYDSETNIVTLSAVMENGEKLEIEEIYGSAFFDENGKLDAVMDLDGEYILLSEMQNLNLIQNCGWFSNLFKKIAKVVVAVAAVAVCVATAGAGVAAVIAVGAAVSCAESLATQLIETGTVNVGRLAVETAIGAIPGGQGAKTVAKETVKVASSTVGKKVVKEATSTATEKVVGKIAGNVADKYANKTHKELIEFLKNEKVSPEAIKARVDKLPSPTNNKWSVIDSRTGKKISSSAEKNDFAKNGANGVVVRLEDGKQVEVADVVQGALVFRENYVKKVFKLNEKVVENRYPNFSNFDSMLVAQLKDNNIKDDFIKSLRDYFKEQSKTIATVQVSDIRKYRTLKGLTWHECSDSRTAQLVESKIHTGSKGGITHTGGVSEVKKG